MSNNLLNKETKRDKFVRLVEQRVNLVLDSFRKLGNLSNTNNYEYKDEDIKKIFSELNKSLKKTKALFIENGPVKSKPFKLQEGL